MHIAANKNEQLEPIARILHRNCVIILVHLSTSIFCLPDFKSALFRLSSVMSLTLVLKPFNAGIDGITVVFYKHFWALIKPLMLATFNFTYESNQLTISQRQSVRTLLEKKGTDRSFLKNWRPVSLLSVDYKILSKVIASRLKRFYRLSFIIPKQVM